MPDTLPTPLCAFDIFDDGTARKAPDIDLRPAAGAAYRWLHFDLASSHLNTWAEAQLPIPAARTLLAAKTRPRTVPHEDGLILTLRGINMNTGDEIGDMVSLRVWMTATLIITVRRQRNFLMEDLQTQISANDAPPTTARLTARIIEMILDRLETAALDLDDLADKFEADVYEKAAPTVKDLAPLRRSVIKFRRHVAPLRDALHGLAHAQTQLIPPLMALRFRESVNRAARALDELNEVDERLTALSDHLDMTQAAKLARNGHRLSVAATLFLPLGLLTGIFGVDLGGMPGRESDLAFYIMLGGLAGLTMLLFLILRWIKWF